MGSLFCIRLATCIFAVFLLLGGAVHMVFAHEADEGGSEPHDEMEEQAMKEQGGSTTLTAKVQTSSVKVAIVSAALLSVLAGTAVFLNRKGGKRGPKNSVKLLLYVSIAAVAVISTLYMAGATIYLNVTSLTK